MKLDKSGLILVAGAAAVLYMVVKKSTVTSVPGASGGQGAIGANAGGFWGNVINNVAGNPSTAGSVAMPGIGGLTLFSNGSYSDGTVYSVPGQVTVNSQTGQVNESPFSGMYNLMSPGTYGF
jgi:hypothetical protein